MPDLVRRDLHAGKNQHGEVGLQHPVGKVGGHLDERGAQQLPISQELHEASAHGRRGDPCRCSFSDGARFVTVQGEHEEDDGEGKREGRHVDGPVRQGPVEEEEPGHQRSPEQRRKGAPHQRGGREQAQLFAFRPGVRGQDERRGHRREDRGGDPVEEPDGDEPERVVHEEVKQRGDEKDPGGNRQEPPLSPLVGQHTHGKAEQDAGERGDGGNQAEHRRVAAQCLYEPGENGALRHGGGKDPEKTREGKNEYSRVRLARPADGRCASRQPAFRRPAFRQPAGRWTHPPSRGEGDGEGRARVGLGLHHRVAVVAGQHAPHGGKTEPGSR